MDKFEKEFLSQKAILFRQSRFQEIKRKIFEKPKLFENPNYFGKTVKRNN